MIGTNNLSQMIMQAVTNKKFVQVFLGLTVLLLIPEFLFKDATLYMIGGIIGWALTEMLESVGVVAKSYLIFSIWLMLLGGVILLFFKTQVRTMRYILLIMSALLLYLFDMLFAKIPLFDMDSIKLAVFLDNVFLILLALIKAFVISLLIHFGLSRNETKKASN